MICRKIFDDSRVPKKWQIIIDGTQLDERYQKKNDIKMLKKYIF